MRTLSIINLKGGVAKTVSSIAIAYILSNTYGYKVLLIDNDKQGDSSRGLGKRDKDKKGIDEIMVAEEPDMESLIEHTEFQNLDIITANMKLLKANKEVLLDQQRPQQIRIQRALEKIKEKYDFCIIDNAPDINISTINALVASNDVIIPLEIDDNTTDGIEELVEQIESVQKYFNENLKFQGCFVTKYDNKNEAHVQGLAYLKMMDYPVFETKIRVSRKVSESTFARKPIFLYSRRSAAAIDYMNLVKEYLQKCSN